MKRFIDLRGQIFIDDDSPLEEREPVFAWYCTVKSAFEKFFDSDTFDSWADFEEAYRLEAEDSKDLSPLERYRRLCPDWVMAKKERTS